MCLARTRYQFVSDIKAHRIARDLRHQIDN